MFLSVWNDFKNVIAEWANKMAISIVSGLFEIVSGIFEIFMILADGSMLDEINIDKLISNFYVVIGVIMLFFVAFAMLKGMINPDDSKQGTSVVKKVIINLVTSAVIMAVLPSIFSFAYDFQKAFIYDYNPIGKFFGYGGDNNTVSSQSDVIKNGANKITNGIFTAIFNANPAACGDGMSYEDCQEEIFSEELGINLKEAINDVDGDGDFSRYATFAKDVPERIKFNVLIGIIAAFVVGYVAISFCFDMAIRLVKLLFFQIIAPIPIFMRIIPDGKISGVFNTWTKKTLSCYFEVYVRIFVFYLALFICDKLLSPEFKFFSKINGSNVFVGFFARAIALMGMVMFMKQAPKLISEMTGINSGNMKLGIREKLKDGGFFAATDSIGGGLGAGITRGKNKINNARNKWNESSSLKKAGLVAGIAASSLYAAGKGAVGGAKYGWKNADYKAAGIEAKKIQTLDEAKAQGMTFTDNATNIVRSKFGFDTTADANLRNIEKSYEIVQNRTSYDIDGMHFGEDGKVHKGKIYSKEGKELTYADGVYKNSDGEIYDPKNKIYDQKGKVLRRFTNSEGLHFDTSGKVYEGKIYGTNSNGEKIELTFENGIYKDKNGVKYTGQIQGENNMSLSYGFKMNASDIEQLGTLSAQKGAANIAYTEEIRAIDKKKEYGKMQSSIKSGLKDESIKKIDEAGSTYRYNFKYYDKDRDKDGNIIEVEKVFNGTYAEIVDFRNRKLTAEQLIDPRVENIDTIRENMINQVIGSEYAGDKGHKAIIVGGLETLKNYGGYTYLVKDPVTKVVTEKKITVSEKDGKYTMEADGVDIYTSVYESFLKNIEKDASVAEAIAKIEREEPDKDKRDAKIKKIKEESASGMAWFKVFSKLDGLVKESNKILDSERRTIEQTLADENKGQKEASENVSKQFKEQNDAKKKSEEQRKKEAAKKYMANRNGK